MATSDELMAQGLTRQIRRAWEESGLTEPQAAKQMGMFHTSIARFRKEPHRMQVFRLRQFVEDVLNGELEINVKVKRDRSALARKVLLAMSDTQITKAELKKLDAEVKKKLSVSDPLQVRWKYFKEKQP